MPFSLQQLPSESKLSHVLRVELLEQLYPPEEVADLLTRCHAWEERERKLSQVVMVYYVIGLSLLLRLNLAAVLRFLARGLRWLWPDPELALPTAGALVYRRKQLGVTVLRQLFRHRCQPMATQETKGAFRFGLRLMAIDSTLDEVADTPANALHFGRLTTGKSASPLPQIRCLYLIEYHLDPQLSQDLGQFPASRNARGTDPSQVHRLLTTLLNPICAPALDLITCYHERWEIENVIDELKTHQRLSDQPLRSQDPALVYQDLSGLLLSHYAVRALMHQSALQAELDPDQLSFTSALQVLETAYYEFAVVAREQLPLLQQRLLVDLREPSSLLPAHRLRFYPRVVKRAFHPFQRKQLWHSGFTFTGYSFREILLISMALPTRAVLFCFTFVLLGGLMALRLR